MNIDIVGFAFYLFVSLGSIAFFAWNYYRQSYIASDLEDVAVEQEDTISKQEMQIEYLECEVARLESLVSLLKLELEEKGNAKQKTNR